MRQPHACRASTVFAVLATSWAWCSPHPVAAQEPRADSQQSVIAIEGVAIVDVQRGEIVTPRTVLVADGRIAAIAEPETVSIPPTAVRVDGRGRYLMPGLVDMHVHLFNNATDRPPNDWAFPLFVANGVTAVREMAAKPADMETIRGWRAASGRGDLTAPHVLAAGVSISAESPAAARERLREAHAAGADFAKVFSPVTERNWRALLDEARRLKMPVCGHIPDEVKLLDAAQAGQSSNEHLTQVFEACSAREKQLVARRRSAASGALTKILEGQEQEVLDTFDQPACDLMAAALADTGQVQVPTLVLDERDARGSHASFHDDSRWRYLRADEQARWQSSFRTQPMRERGLASRRLEVSWKIVKTLHAAGVRVLAGTDAPMPLVYPGFALHKELELLVEAGLTPADALRAATIWPAEFLGLGGSSGSVTVGKRADLVLLDADPLHEISNTQRIHAVLLNGRLLQRAELDALLDRRPTDSPTPPAGAGSATE